MNFYNLFFNIQSIPSVIIAILLFIWGRPKKKYFWWSLIGSSILVTGIYSTAWYFIKRFLMGNGGMGYRYIMVACNFAAVFLLLFVCWLCFDCNITDYFVFIVAGWVTQHLAGMIANVIAKLCGMDLNYVDYDWRYFLMTVLSYIVVYSIIWLWFGSTRRNGSGIVNKGIYIPSVILFLVVVVLNIYAPTELSTSDYIVVKCYAISSCVVSLFLIFGAFENGRLTNEIAVMEELDRKKSKQYEISKESMDVINTRYHDLKKLMGMLTSEGKKLSDEELAKLNEEINYQSIVARTGNKALDTVCTEKGLYCRRNSIEMDVVVDAKSLQPLEELDIYSLFSNILDNAIEAQMKLDENKRVVNLSIRQVDSLLFIHCDNPFEGKLKTRGERIITTKQNNNHEHGYGIMSVHRIVDKYGGEIALTDSNGIFNIDIVIPVVK